jgi:DNA-binding MarR family transcriptional regulator
MSAGTTNEYHFSEQIGHLLRRAYQRHMAIFQKTVPDSQLTATQFVVLCSVRDLGQAEIPDIVRETAIDESSVRGIVERLKWRTLVTVAHEPGDTRHMTVSLTPDGRDLIEQTVPYARQISELTFGDLSPEDRTALITLLRRISDL